MPQLFRSIQIKHYFISRHPIKRLESFYRDKFLLNPNNLYQKTFGWQPCQQLFFNDLGLTNNMTNEEISQRLQNTSFRSFIKLLPEKYMKDAHLNPQVHILHFKYKRINWKLNITRYLKMESESDMNFLSENLGLDLSKKSNFTQRINPDLSMTHYEKEIVNNVYKKDFQHLNYDFLS